MQKHNFPLATSTWDEKEIDALHAVIESGRFTMGPKVAEAEKRFADLVGSSHALMVNSGSSANLLIVASLFFRSENPLKRGDVVVVPSVSWSTTYAPLQQLGLRVRFVDIDPCTLNIDLEKLETAICPNTRLIFAVNLLGNPVDYHKLKEMTAHLDLMIIEDNCEALGAEIDDKCAGTFGLAGSFSSFFSHHISTMEGGFVVTDDDELFQIMASVREHGWTRCLPLDNFVSGKKSSDWFEESFRFVLPGFNLRPLEMSGALAIEQIKKLPNLIRGRRENALQFQALASRFSNIRIQLETGQSSWFGFALIVDDPIIFSRAKLRQALDRLAFEYRPVVAGNFLRNPVLRWFDVDGPRQPENFHVAEHVHHHGLFIGNHHYPMKNAFEVLAKLEELL